MEAYRKLILVLSKTIFGVYLMETKIRAKPISSFRIRKRSDIDIMANILSVANKRMKKTRIMYRCNLSHGQLEVYLQLLLDMSFLESDSKKEGVKLNYFRTTSKGFKFLDAYHTLKSLMT